MTFLMPAMLSTAATVTAAPTRAHAVVEAPPELPSDKEATAPTAAPPGYADDIGARQGVSGDGLRPRAGDPENRATDDGGNCDGEAEVPHNQNLLARTATKQGG